MLAPKNSFSKKDRLKSKKAIDNLFKTGRSYFEDPVRIIFNISESENPELKAGIAVPKKKLKKTYQRNLVKRRIKESYRQNNKELKELIYQKGLSCHLMYYYQSSEILLFKDLSPKIMLLLQRLQKHIEAKFI